MTDYGQIRIDLTGVTATVDTTLSFQIHGSGFTFGGQQDLSFEGMLGVTGMALSPVNLILEVSAGTTLGGVITLYAVTGKPGPVALTSNANDFTTSGSKAFDVTWTTNSSGILEGNIISGALTLTDFGPE